MDPIALTGQISDATFAEMVQSSSRKVREVLYSQFGIKTKKKFSANLQERRDERVRKLHERLKTGSTKQEAEVCRELIRNWLYGKRPLLKSTLDFLEVPNDNGLVEIELDFFTNLHEDKVEALVKYLCTQFQPEHVAIYLRFVEVPHLDKFLTIHDVHHVAVA